MRPYVWSLFIYAGLAAEAVMGAESSEETFSTLSTALSEDDQCADSGAEGPSPHCSLSALQLRGAKLGVDEEVAGEPSGGADSWDQPEPRADEGAEPALLQMEEAFSENKPKATAAPVERRNDLTSGEAAGLLRKATSQEKDIKKEKEMLNDYWVSLNATRAKVEKEFPSQLLLQAAVEALEDSEEELGFEMSSQGPRETQVSKKLMSLQHMLNKMWKSITDLDRSNADLKNQVGSYKPGKLLQQESNRADPEEQTAEASETADPSASEGAAEETPTVESTAADTTETPEEVAAKRKSTKGNTTRTKAKEQADDDDEPAVSSKKKLKGAVETTKAPKGSQPRSGQPKEDPAASPGLAQLKTFSEEIQKQIEKFQHELDKVGVALDTVSTMAQKWLKAR